MDLLRSFKDKARLARQLSPSDWLALTEAWWWLFYLHLALRWMSYERIAFSVRPISKNISELSDDLFIAQRLQRLVGIASRLYLIPMTCLVRSLTLQKMLNSRNISAQVRIGAQKIQGALYAHAWVEVNGNPIGEADDIAQKFNILESAVEIDCHQFN